MYFILLKNVKNVNVDIYVLTGSIPVTMQLKADAASVVHNLCMAVMNITGLRKLLLLLLFQMQSCFIGFQAKQNTFGIYI